MSIPFVTLYSYIKKKEILTRFIENFQEISILEMKKARKITITREITNRLEYVFFF